MRSLDSVEKQVTRAYAHLKSNESTEKQKITAKSAQKQSKNETTAIINRQPNDASTSKQICLLTNFRVGDIAFVHLKGYNNWPAKIIQTIEGKRKRYFVEFFEFKTRRAFVYQSQITDFIGGIRSELIKSQIRKNVELNRYTKEAMVHIFGRIIELD